MGNQGRLARLLTRRLGQFTDASRNISSTSGSGGRPRAVNGTSTANNTAAQHQQTRSAQAVAVQQRAPAEMLKVVVPAVQTDLYGAVSMVSEGEKVRRQRSVCMGPAVQPPVLSDRTV